MSTPAIPERFNLYTAVHKGLRSQLCETLVRVGRLDTQDEAEFAAVLAEVDDLLDTCLHHVEHENDFLHTALDACARGWSRATAADHLEHLDEIAALRRGAQALAAADVGSRDALSLALYRELALFVAENLRHMQVEETDNAAALWAHYSDVELLGIHDRLVASLTPVQALAGARWMIPAATPFERACMVRGMKEQMPPEALLGVFAHVEPHLDAAGRAKLNAVVRPRREVEATA